MILRRLRVLWAALELVPWVCEYCLLPQETSALLWPELRYRLICRRCRKMQNYPGYIQPIDPMAKEFR